MEALIGKARRLIDKITSNVDDPNPNVLHALASILETGESRLEGNSSSAYTIPRLGRFIRDNDFFFTLISFKFLSETTYSVSVQAASVRLMFSCSLMGMLKIDDEDVLKNIEGWAIDERTRSFGSDQRTKSSDTEMLRTYSIGLLAIHLARGGQVVLKSRLAAKLMWYLRVHVLDETSNHQKDISSLIESRSAPINVSFRDRVENRGRFSHSYVPRIRDDVSLRDGKAKSASRSLRDEDFDETSRGDSSRRRAKHEVTSRAKGRVVEAKERVENQDLEKIPNTKKSLSRGIAHLISKAVGAAEAEAKSANAPVGAVRAAAEAASELVTTAASKEFRKTGDVEAAILAASRAASQVVSAANTVEVLRISAGVGGDSDTSESAEQETSEDVEEFIFDSNSLAKLRDKYCIQCLVFLGKDVEVLQPVLHQKGVDVCLALLQQTLKHKEASKVVLLLPDILKLICALAAHRKFANEFLDRSGLQKMLAVPIVSQTLVGLSNFLTSCSEGIMERISALPSNIVRQFVELVLKLLECSQDEVRETVAVVFPSAFGSRAVIDAFKYQGGLRRTLNLLRDAAFVRSGVSSGMLSSSGPRNDQSSSEELTYLDKMITLSTCVSLREYFRAHFLLLVESIRPNRNTRYEPLDLSDEATDAVFRRVQRDRNLGLALVKEKWHVVDKFLACNGHITMLELCQAEQHHRHLTLYALGVLHIITLVPYSCKNIVNATLSNGRVGIAVILGAADGTGPLVVPEKIEAALNVLVNLVCPAPSISNKPPAVEGYCQAREAVRSNNGIEVLLNLLEVAPCGPPSYLYRVRELACRVLLGLARDDTIAHILTKLQIGNKLSEIIRQTPGSEELVQVAVELIGVVTNSGRPNTLAATDPGWANTLPATDAATPLRRIERAAIAAATPITYHSRELLLLIHEHLQATGLSGTAGLLLKEAQLTPLHQTSGQESSLIQIQWPAGRTPRGFLSDKSKLALRDEDPNLRCDANLFSTPSFLKDQQARSVQGTVSANGDDIQSSNSQMVPSSHHGFLNDPQPQVADRLTLDSIVVQYLKHQHQQCPAPITSLPPLSLLHPHVCPEPHRRRDAPSNVTARLGTRELTSKYGGIQGIHKGRQFVYSRFRPWRTCRDDPGSLSTCISFLGDASQIAVGSHLGELKTFDSNRKTVLESCAGHENAVTMLQSYFSGETRLILSSSVKDVRLWDASFLSAGPKLIIDGCKEGRFCNSGTLFGALALKSSPQEIRLYDVQRGELYRKLTYTWKNPSDREQLLPPLHFSPCDKLLLWSGSLWDHRISDPIHRFEQFTNYGGGGFHPARNEVIINSEVWDLRKYRLLCSVPSLGQTSIKFNSSGDVIYAILRRYLDDLESALHPRRSQHPFFLAFHTVDAVSYSDIATIPVGHCCIDFATEPTDSFVGLVTLDPPKDKQKMISSRRLYTIGRRISKDDSDTDDAEET